MALPKTERHQFLKIINKEECIPVGCVPPAAVAVRGALHQAPPLDQASPRTRQLPQTWHSCPPPGTRHSPDPGTPRDQAPPCGHTHTCKHITLPQTSFAGGNNVDVQVRAGRGGGGPVQPYYSETPCSGGGPCMARSNASWVMVRSHIWDGVEARGLRTVRSHVGGGGAGRGSLCGEVLCWVIVTRSPPPDRMTD